MKKGSDVMECVTFSSKNTLLGFDFDEIKVDEFWNRSSNREARMHTIHNYPAKFPAFIADKAIEYALPYFDNKINKISDVFCGCGTVALESRIHGIDFWGCDINPVATLIAKTKSEVYNVDILKKIENRFALEINSILLSEFDYSIANERIKYWFDERQFIKLSAILKFIDQLPNSKYKQAFFCLFSSILKATSNWLTKSIKPQIDPAKKPIDPIVAFEESIDRFISIVEEGQVRNSATIKIENCNFITKRKLPQVDLIITSPPYVTSYEYADLHQLSSLWLGYADDYKELRKGTIGSVYNSEDYYFDLIDLNETAISVVQALYKAKSVGNAKTKSVARYYVDMQVASKNCYRMLSENGISIFIIGDTEYKGVKIENAKHLVESLLDVGFESVKVSKRRISNKTLSPYRDEHGKFSSDAKKRKVYHEEYIIISHKRGQ